MKKTLTDAPPAGPGQRFCYVRQQTEALCEPLTAEDMMVQSCDEASPAKWHLAHTTWFFETFLLSEFLPDYQPFPSRFSLALQQLLQRGFGTTGKEAARVVFAAFAR